MSAAKAPVPPEVSERKRQNIRGRWGPQRVVRLDDLTGEQRRLVLALIDAAKAEKAAADEQHPATAQEVRRASVEAS